MHARCVVPNEKRFALLFGLVHEIDEEFTSTSSKVVMSYFAFRNGKSCMLATLDISGNGGNGPSFDPLLANLAPGAFPFCLRYRSHSNGRDYEGRTCCSTFG